MDVHADRRLAPYTLLLATVAVGGAVTALASLSPFIHLAYRSAPVHVALETSGALVALLAAYLVFGRFRVSGRANDLALVYPLALFASTNLFVSAFQALSSSVEPNRLATWTPAMTRLVAAATLAAAAFVPPRLVASPVGAARLVWAACLATLTTVALFVNFVGDALPKALERDVAAVARTYPAFTAHPGFVATHVAAVVLFGLAAMGFARASERDGDELMRWFAGGAGLASFASLNYTFSPTLYSNWVYTGDVLRVGFYILLLVGAAREIQRHWEGQARAAVLEERRRLARDLHDGLAQELAFIWRQARRLATSDDAAALAPLTGAVERALHESRRAVAALRSAPNQSLAAAMVDAVDAVAARVGAAVIVDVPRDTDVSPKVREELLRIACEAVANAGTHGRARVIRVQVTGGRQLSLTVTDDGAGFDTTSLPRVGKFGVLSMQERARALGGRLDIRSRPGQGTRVELVLP